jgi:uncharacterized protein YqfA (UPF0365 family)
MQTTERPRQDATMQAADISILVGGIVALAILLVAVRVLPLRVWIAARAAGVPVSLPLLIGMRMRRVDPRAVVEPLILAHKAGLTHITISMLESHYLAGGHVDRVVFALIAADKAGISLTWEKETAIDLSGRDVYEDIKQAVERDPSRRENQ